MGRRIVIVLAVVVGLAAVGWGAWAWHRSTIEVSTDDAYVDGMISPVSAKVSGHVVELLVNDNKAVRAGECSFGWTLATSRPSVTRLGPRWAWPRPACGRPGPSCR